jgi:hypothetical protein
MDIQRLIDMDDDTFAHCVSQTMKRRSEFPDWWRALLHPDVIADTEEVVKGFLRDGLRQAEDPARYPRAAGFVENMRGVLAEIAMSEIVAAPDRPGKEG